MKHHTVKATNALQIFKVISKCMRSQKKDGGKGRRHQESVVADALPKNQFIYLTNPLKKLKVGKLFYFLFFFFSCQQINDLFKSSKLFN